MKEVSDQPQDYADLARPEPLSHKAIGAKVGIILRSA